MDSVGTGIASSMRMPASKSRNAALNSSSRIHSHRTVNLPDRRIDASVRSISAGLVWSQEAESKRLAAELHDGLNQEVAVVAIDLGFLAQRLTKSDSLVRDEVLKIQQKVLDLSNEIRRISHQLHPAVLECVGLEGALRAHCRELSRCSGIEVLFVARNAGSKFPPAMELAIYRVAQEALRNAVKHSQANLIRVTLEGVKGGIRLTVADTGCGFDASAQLRNPGLGFLSMRERVKLVGGKITVRSRANAGTEVEAFFPLEESRSE